LLTDILSESGCNSKRTTHNKFVRPVKTSYCSQSPPKLGARTNEKIPKGKKSKAMGCGGP
jgi:hypothetical protein